MRLRPKYKMNLVKQIEQAIFDEYKSYSSVEAYINEFIKELDWDRIGCPIQFNFKIQYKKNSSVIDLTRTLLDMPQEDLFTIAIDIGINLPMILPSFPTFIRILTPAEQGSSYAKEMFDKAYKLVLEDPAQAIGLANSTLESIVKHILENSKVTIKYNKNNTLYELTETILKEFNFFPSKKLHKNIKNIGSSLLCLAREIEELRSDNTFAHGKAKDDYVIDNSLYSTFILNTIITTGLFIISFFEAKYKLEYEPKEQINDEEVPF